MICTLQIVTLLVTWSGWISILPVAANIAATIGGYTHNPRKIRVAGMFINSPLWIIYDILVGSWAGILDEIVTEASMIISIIRYGWKALASHALEEFTVMSLTVMNQRSQDVNLPCTSNPYFGSMRVNSTK